jgi:tetratricopeptide (TPR) repeat protein
VAGELFTEIRRWHPRTVERDRIYRALGEIAAAAGDRKRAIEFYERFERETAASVHLGEVRLKMADLHAAAGNEREARATLEQTLETAGVSADVKARTLLRLGDSFAASDEHGKAVVYFERLYVAYGKFSELNARAYWKRGQSLERLKLDREALETYEELVAREDLARFEESKRAAERIASLRPRFPKEEANGGKEETL